MAAEEDRSGNRAVWGCGYYSTTDSNGMVRTSRLYFPSGSSISDLPSEAEYLDLSLATGITPDSYAGRIVCGGSHVDGSDVDHYLTVVHFDSATDNTNHFYVQEIWYDRDSDSYALDVYFLKQVPFLEYEYFPHSVKFSAASFTEARVLVYENGLGRYRGTLFNLGEADGSCRDFDKSQQTVTLPTVSTYTMSYANDYFTLKSDFF